MTEILAYPLNTASFDNEYYEATDAQTYTCTRTTGVYSADDDLRVVATGSRGITVLEGLGWLKFAKFRGIAVANTVEKNGVVSFNVTPSVTLSRIDRVVVSYNYNTDKVDILLRQGTTSSSPVPPPLRRNGTYFEIGLADIFVGIGSGNITQANITDLRLNESLCGIMRDGVTGIPTQGLYDQFNIWFEGIKKEMEGFDPAEILNKISLIDSRVSDNTNLATLANNRSFDNSVLLALMGSGAPTLSAWTQLPLNPGYLYGNLQGVKYWVDKLEFVHLVFEVYRDNPANSAITTMPYGIVPPFNHFFIARKDGGFDKIPIEINPFDRILSHGPAIYGGHWDNFQTMLGYTCYKANRN